MDNDDKPIGKVLDRRKVLAVLGVGGLLSGQNAAALE